jgi:chemotaxis-related protein WspB
MLFLLTRLDGDAFALDCGHVVEVLPRVDLIAMADAPRGVAGLLNYHGMLVPVVDLAMLTRGRMSLSRRSTRIVVLRSERDGESPRLVALLGERATELLHAAPQDFAESGIVRDAPSLGGIKLDQRGPIQLLKPVAIVARGHNNAAPRPAAA